jgi:hypothetical protein
MNEKYPYTDYDDNSLEYLNKFKSNQDNAMQRQILEQVDELDKNLKPFWELQGISKEDALLPMIERTNQMTEMIKGTDKGKELLKNGDLKKHLNQTLLDMKNIINLVGYVQQKNEIQTLRQNAIALSNEIERTKNDNLQRLQIQPNTTRKIE